MISETPESIVAEIRTSLASGLQRELAGLSSTGPPVMQIRYVIDRLRSIASQLERRLEGCDGHHVLK